MLMTKENQGMCTTKWRMYMCVIAVTALTSELADTSHERDQMRARILQLSEANAGL